MKAFSFSLGAKLWLALLVVIFLLFFTLTFATMRGSSLQARVDAALAAQGHKTQLSLQWSGLVETQLTRIVASAATADPAVDELFKTQIPATSARITDIQKQVEATGLSEPEQKLFARIAEERRVSLASLAKVLELKKAGNQPAAATELRGVMLPQVDKYVKSLEEFGGEQNKAYQRLGEQFQVERDVNTWVTRAMVIGLVLILVCGTAMLIRLIRQPLRDAIAVAETIASGDLRVAVDASRGDEFGEMLKAIAHMRDQLVRLVADVRHGTDSISTASQEIATGNMDLANRTEQTAANLEKAAASMEELTATVKQSVDSAQQANQLAGSAATVAHRGGEVVHQVVTTMTDINASSHKIADIISVIDSIAFQTNILALNAAVEAARAGEQGRGFAVVASEVRSLASRTTEAAREIKTLIQASVGKVESGTQLVSAAGQTMADIVNAVQRVTDIMGGMSTAANEQFGGITEVNHAVGQLDEMTQRNAALVEQSAAAASSLSEQAQRLAQVVAAFKLDDGPAPGQPAQRMPPPMPRREVQAPRVAARKPTMARLAQPQAPAHGE